MASAFDPEKMSEAHNIYREVVLLRVLGPATLPSDSELLRTRVEHNQRRTADEVFSQDVHDGLDPNVASSELKSDEPPNPAPWGKDLRVVYAAADVALAVFLVQLYRRTSFSLDGPASFIDHAGKL